MYTGTYRSCGWQCLALCQAQAYWGWRWGWNEGPCWTNMRQEEEKTEVLQVIHSVEGQEVRLMM